MKRKVISFVLASILCFSLVFSIGAATKPKLNSKNVTLVVGQSFKLKVSGKNIKKKTFKTTNKKVAKVSKKGKITAKALGKCKIKVTVKFKNKKVKKLTCKVVVKTVPVTKKQAQTKKTEQQTTKQVPATRSIEDITIVKPTRKPVETTVQPTTKEKPTFDLPDIDV